MEKPKKTITVDKARELQKNWMNKRANVIDHACGYTDCREFWYSIEEIEEYIAYVKANAAGREHLGLRFYFGTYGPTETHKDGLSTLFIAPTHRKDDIPGALGKEGCVDPTSDECQDNMYDMDPLNRGTGGEPPINF